MVYVLGENSQLLGYLMPELKSADKFEWPNIPLAIQVFRQLLSILCFFKKARWSNTVTSSQSTFSFEKCPAEDLRSN